VVHPGGRLVVDEANRILEPFAQTDSTITRSSEDTGLGLALCRQLCELMGGTVSVLGNDDETRFTMQVPTKDAFVHAPAGPAPVVADERSTVLVIDEDDELGGLLGQTLEREGLSVLRAGSGADGLRLARAHRPGVICLGVAAPSLEGWSVLRALKSDLDLDGIPVVVVTMGEDRERGVALTATDFVVKPVNRGDLMRVLARLGVGAKGGPILVVDDSEAVREVVGRMLRAEGWEVVEAENGRVALERIAERRPALVLLDLIMPEVDGYRVVSEMHRHPEWSTIPVVIVTAADIPPTLRDFLERRVEAVIGKGGDDQRAVLDKVRRLVIHHLGSPPTLPEDG